MHIHYTRFTHGETVYLKTDVEQHKRMVTGIKLRPGLAMYELSFGSESSEHYDIEMTSEPDENIRLGIDKVNSE